MICRIIFFGITMVAVLFSATFVIAETSPPEQANDVHEKLAAQLPSLIAKGYAQQGAEQIEEVDHEKEKLINLRLEAGISYAIASACASPCDHVEVSLSDQKGKLLVKSPDISNIAIIAGTPDATGVYSVKIAVPGCKQARCYAGITVLKNAEAAQQAIRSADKPNNSEIGSTSDPCAGKGWTARRYCLTCCRENDRWFQRCCEAH